MVDQLSFGVGSRYPASGKGRSGMVWRRSAPWRPPLIQFILSLQLLHVLRSQGVWQFSSCSLPPSSAAGVSMRCSGAPLAVLMTQGTADERQAMLRRLFVTNLVLALVGSALLWMLGEALGISTAALLFAGYGAVALLVWASVCLHRRRPTQPRHLISAAFSAG